MGFKEFASQNSSFLSKQAWRCLQNSNEYWALILRGIYYKNEDFWEVNPKLETSWVWRSLLHGRDILKTEGRRNIGSGHGVKLVKDNWLSFGNKAEVKEGCMLTMVDALIDQNTHSWNINSLIEALSPHSAIEAP